MTTTLTPERIEEMATALRGYAATEHGKRFGLHTDIMRLVFSDPLSLADALSRDGMREALVKLVNAKALSGVRELVAGWSGEGKPDGPYGKHPPKLGAHIPTNCGAIYELDEAMTAARAALSPDAPRQKVEE